MKNAKFYGYGVTRVDFGDRGKRRIAKKISAIGSMLKVVKTVIVRGHRVKDESLELIGRTWPELKQFECWGDSQMKVTAAGIQALSEQCPQLEKLVVRGLRLTSADLQNLVPHWASMRELHALFDKSVSHSDFKRIAKSCRWLRVTRLDESSFSYSESSSSSSE